MRNSQHNWYTRTLLGLLATVAASHVAAAVPEVEGGPIPVGATDVLSVSGGLLAVIAAILLVGFLYSRLKGPRMGGGSVINVLASQALGPKEHVVLIQIADKQLVLGMTASQVQTLHVFDEPVVETAQPTGDFNFAERLKLAIGGYRK